MKGLDGEVRAVTGKPQYRALWSVVWNGVGRPTGEGLPTLNKREKINKKIKEKNSGLPTEPLWSLRELGPGVLESERS